MASKKTVAGQEVAKAVGAGKAVALESVDFSDPNRPRTCLEVDFPILPVNRIAAIEGKGSGALKPIYQVSKWWARRRSSVFRSMLIAAVTKAPEDPSHAAKLVWDNYYANHQKRGAFKHLKIADIFMGGGTTLFEGSRLGMQMIGNDLNPVAWFVVKPELAEVDPDEVKSLLADIEAQVKPQIMPYFYCDGPEGERGTWTHLPTKTLMGADFDPLSVSPEQRHDYTYEGPEVIYSFWSKHGPCQVIGCGHRTPIMTSPLIAMKSLTVKYWEHSCTKCSRTFHVEEKAARLAPDVALFVSTSEHPFSILDRQRGAVCPHCGHTALVSLGKGKSKKVELSLLVHPQWLSGAPSHAKDGQAFGGSAQDDSNSSALWDQRRAASIRLLEVRGKLPNEVTCPETNVTFRTDIGTVPKRSSYTCASCGTVQDVLSTVKVTGKTGPMAGYAVQAYSPGRSKTGQPNSGKFFAPFGSKLADQYDKAAREWEQRKDGDLRDYWPRSEVPYGFMTGIANGDVRTGHGFTHWWTMFNPRQLLVLAQILKAIATEGNYSGPVREAVLAAFQQYIRNENMFCFWNLQRALEPMFSNNNFHPKMNVVENSVFSGMARGDFLACASKATESRLWAENPWEIACFDNDEHSEKVTIGDNVSAGAKIGHVAPRERRYVAV